MEYQNIARYVLVVMAKLWQNQGDWETAMLAARFRGVEDWLDSPSAKVSGRRRIAGSNL